MVFLGIILLMVCWGLFLFLIFARATVYHVGPGQPITALAGVPWPTLQPGDTVMIHYRATPYYEKLGFGFFGTPEQPVTIQGVSGPGGEKPIISGNNAVTPGNLNFPGENRALIKIGQTNTPSCYDPPCARNIIIDNLELKDARPDYTFSDRYGVAGNVYAQNAACIWVATGVNITISNCIIRECGNGIFSTGYGSTQNLLIKNNHIYDNGIVNSILEHNTYTSSTGIIYEGNHMGTLRAGCLGNNLKDRSSGTVIRYNYIENGNRQLDLVDMGAYAVSDPAYRRTFVYGNVLAEWFNDGNRQMINYGGDGSDTAYYRKGTLYVYHNTFITKMTETSLIRCATNDESANVFHNVIYSFNPGNTLYIAETAGQFTLTRNWITTGFLDTKVPTSFLGTVTKSNNIGGTTSPFVDLNNKDFHLSAALSYSVSYPADVIAYATQTMREIASIGTTVTFLPPSVARADTSDLGGFDYVTAAVPCATLPTPPANAGVGNCVANSASGTTCTPTCNTGFSGTLSATCNSGVWVVTGTCTASACATLPSIPNSGAGTCVANSASGTTCTPACNSGFTGSLSATCNSGTWSYTGTCTSTACSTLPSIPNAGAGNCVANSASGTTCTPACNTGFAGTLSATCNSAMWTTSGSCVSTACPTTPTIANGSPGNCAANSASGTTCTPVCISGFTGTLSAQCSSGSWLVTGTCTSTSCSSLPPAPNSLAGSCVVPASSGTTCAPTCASGYTGTISATCNSGTWVITGTCSSTSCSTLPSIPNAGAGNCAAHSPTGTTCTPTCNSGYAGTLSATCTNAVWYHTGTCTSTSCSSLPSISNAGAGNCLVGTASGTTCTPSCNSGFTGTLSATCNNAVWTTTGMCTSTACASLPPISNSAAGDCVAPSPGGTVCAPVCNTGYAGTLSATCNNAAWTVEGTCTSTACPSLPSIANAGIGNCVAGSASGTSCTPLCNTGYTGTLTAICNNAMWSTSGFCTGNPCAGLPTIADASSGNCVVNSASGTSCVPLCNLGFSGTLSASCNLGTWSHTGTCVATGGSPCSTLPSITNAGVGDCVANSASGTTCTPTCNSGYAGTLSATCDNSAWITTGSCSSTACADTPSIANSGPGDCVAGSASGTTCTPVCNSGFTGTLSATCTNAAWISTGGCVSTSCSTLPLIPNGSAGDCVANSASGTTCTPLCNSGFSGTLSASCNSGVWSTVGACGSTACQTLPIIINAGAGNCVVNSASGSTCTPTCNAGFAGTLSATCNSGVWSSTGSCASTACASLPTIPNSGPGDCQLNAATGTTCTPVCDTGFVGTLSATCNSGVWQESGGCTGAPCAGLPALTNSGSGDCVANSAHGTSCTPVCNSGFTGTVSAACNSGVWTVTGACAAVTGQPCASTPTVPDGSIGDCTANSVSGATCTPVCNSGFSGTLLATCSSGNWMISGSCASTACASSPSIANAIPGDCVANSPDGTVCTPVCNSGFGGTLSATCNVGSWSISGVCSDAACGPLPTILHGTSGNCISGTASGTGCTPLCEAGFDGSLSASCSAGAWTVTGSCSASACASLPNLPPNTNSGTCSANSASGTSCVAVCAPGFQLVSGGLNSLCSAGTWDPISAVCEAPAVSRSCSDTPALPNSKFALGTCDISSSVNSGDSCEFACQDGYKPSSNLTIFCIEGAWTNLESGRSCVAQGSTSNVGVIVGAVVGSLAGVAVLVGLAVWWHFSHTPRMEMV